VEDLLKEQRFVRAKAARRTYKTEYGPLEAKEYYRVNSNKHKSYSFSLKEHVTRAL